MKVLIVAVAFLAARGVDCQTETVTENLLRAQAELNLGNRFTQSQFANHREMITDILEDLTKYSIDLYLDSVDVLRNVAAETRAQMSQMTSSECVENSRERWDRQVRSHLLRINFCLQEATRILNGEYYDKNYFDKDGSRVSSHTPNQGLHVLSLNSIFDTRGDYYALINNRLRDLLLRAGPWVATMDELLELMEHHTQQARDGVSFCTTLYTMQVHKIAAAALEEVAKC